VDDVAFKRDRLQAAIGKLQERLAELKDREENARRQVVYDKAKVVRDELANELADLYPPLAQKVVELLARVEVPTACSSRNSRHAACLGSRTT